jgi:hypothetical protein
MQSPQNIKLPPNLVLHPELIEYPTTLAFVLFSDALVKCDFPAPREYMKLNLNNSIGFSSLSNGTILEKGIANGSSADGGLTQKRRYLLPKIRES